MFRRMLFPLLALSLSLPFSAAPATASTSVKYTIIDGFICGADFLIFDDGAEDFDSTVGTATFVNIIASDDVIHFSNGNQQRNTALLVSVLKRDVATSIVLESFIGFEDPVPTGAILVDRQKVG